MKTKLIVAALGAVLLTGCTSIDLLAPIEDRSGEQAARPAEEAVTETGSRVIESKSEHFAAEREAVASGRTHTVARGDTVYNIGLRYNVAPRELMRLNGIEDPTKLSLGQTLEIPLTAGATVEATPVETQVSIEVSPQEGAVVEGQAVAVDAAGTEQVTITPQEPAKQAVAEVPQAEAAKAEEPEIEVAKRPESAEEIANRKIAEEKAKREAAARGELTLPWPVKGEVIADFNTTKMGIDIAGNMDDPIQCVLDGTVQYVGNNTAGYGSFVIVRHNVRLPGSGTMPLITVYGNTSKILVRVGESVRAGQEIALMGKSGSSVVKLRFEVRQGKPVDPMQYLEKLN